MPSVTLNGDDAGVFGLVGTYSVAHINDTIARTRDLVAAESLSGDVVAKVAAQLKSVPVTTAFQRPAHVAQHA